VSKTGNKTKQADTTQFTPHGGELALTGRKKKSWLPFIGIVLVLAGLVFFAATSGMAAAQWLLGLWPLFAIIAGVASVMGFAVERKPKSPVGGMLLIFVGVLFSAGRFHSNLNALQIYGRYWILLLFVFAGVELVRHYSHRLNDGKPPRLFSIGKLLMVTLIVGSGVLANRVAVNNPSVLASLKLPAFLNSLRDSVIGETYNFTDEAIPIPTLKPNAILSVNNSHGNVTVVSGLTYPRAVLSKNIRAWKKEDANTISDKIKLQLTQNSDGSVNISTNRDDLQNEVNHEFNTHIQIEVPATFGVSITNSYGNITANEIQGDVTLKSSYGRAEANNVKGNATFNLKNSEAVATSIQGDVKVTGARKVKLSNIDGSVEVEGSNGSVDLRNIGGTVNIDSSYSRVIAQDLKQSATIKTSHESVKVTNAGSVSIEAPFSDITAKDIRGDLQIESSNDDIRATSISGNLKVEAERSSVRADEIQGQVKINTSHGDVSLKNFHQGVEIETSYRDVVLTVGEQVTGDITVENSRGEIKFIYPQSNLFRIDAKSERGRVKARGIDDFQQDEKDSLLKGSTGPMVKLRTTFSDILVQAGGLRQAQNKGVVQPSASADRD
jgi:DUF4097 and DUF4098 domain-containing protein YvlB/uncharacterized membrane protein HdeD (DUF308 family)